MKKRFIAIAVAGVLLSGCDTMQKKDMGTIIGGVAGVVVGSALGGDSKSAQRNAMIAGALVGSLVGRQIGSYFDEQEQKAIAEARARALDSARLPEPITGKSGATYAIEEIRPVEPAQQQVANAPAATTSTAPVKTTANRTASAQSPVPTTTTKTVTRPKTPTTGFIRTASAPAVGECRVVRQKINLPDGRTINDDARFCKQPPDPGQWLET